MISQLKDKSVLFIGQVFYDYHLKIIDALTLLGANVDFFENKMFREDPVILNDLISWGKRVKNPSYKTRYASEVLSETSTKKYDYLFVIGGFSVSETLINGIRKANPGIKCILYLWDSFDIYDYSKLLPLFDKCYSFERKDSNTHQQLNHLQLFYTDEYESDKTETPSTDFCYVGAVGPVSINRIEVLAKIQKQTNGKYSSFIWLYYKKPQLGAVKRGLNFIRRKVSVGYNGYMTKLNYALQHYDFVRHDTLSRNEVSKIAAASKCVIDIPVPNQNGLTIRTIESLAAGKKLLTTNMAIRDEEFYNENMIHIIDEKSETIDLTFMDRPFVKLDLQHLHLKNWLLQIFNI